MSFFTASRTAGCFASNMVGRTFSSGCGGTTLCPNSLRMQGRDQHRRSTLYA